MAPPVDEASSVEVSPLGVAVFEGDTLGFQAAVRGIDGSTLSGRSVTWVSSDPEVLEISSEGRAVALRPGSVRVTASCEGVSGWLEVDIHAFSADYLLLAVDGRALPLTVDSADVQWNGRTESHVVRLEQGSFQIQGGPQRRYRVTLDYREYRVVDSGTGARLEPVLGWLDGDMGLVSVTASGALSLVSEIVYPLEHTAQHVGDSIRLRFRIPGEDTILTLDFVPGV